MTGEDGHAARRALLLGLTLLFPLALLLLSLLLASQSALGSGGLLTNGGFEDGTTDWNQSPNVTFAITDFARSGNWAASLNRTDGVPGEIWIYQDVDLDAGTTYTLTGWAYNYEPSFNQVCLRINWLDSSSPDVQSCLDGLAADYRPITVGPTLAPPDTVTARIMARANVANSKPANPVCFDDLSFTSNIPPTPTPIPYYVPLVLKDYR